MIKLSKKTIIVTLALIAIIATAGTAFAYWSSGFNNTGGDQTATIQIGTAESVDTELTLDAMSGGLALVPVNRAGEDATKTESVAYTCNVLWESTDDESALSAAGVTGTLTVELTGLKIDGADYLSGGHPFNFSIKAGAESNTSFNITGDTSLALTFTFTMDEPDSPEQYLLVAGAEVVFTFTFSVAVNNG